jgi:nondiscriminating glutamyl-tRNA synthetase
LRVPENTDIYFHDLIRGDQGQNTKDLTGDFVIAKNLRTPLYNFTVVIDDHLMEITHVMRGEDHLSNTPKQILIYNALNFEIPKFAHFPLILNTDKSKLSKRENAVSVKDYLDQGYLKNALINFLALLGWNPGIEKEIFLIEELIDLFSIEKIQKGGAVFDIDRLNWINTEHIKFLSDDEFIKNAISFFQDKIKENKIDLDKLKYLILQERPRIKRFSDITKNLEFFFHDEVIYDANLLLGKNLEKDFVLNILKEVERVLINDDLFTEESLRNNLIKLINKLQVKNGDVLWPLRAGLTGQDKSPGAFEVAYALGKEKSLERIKNSIKLLEQ